MDTVKTCILLAAAIAATAGCSSRVPSRHAPADSLVRAGELDTSPYSGRRDAGLGLDRAPLVRPTTASTEFTFDRQRVIDGRPYSDFRVTTRTRSALER